MEIEGNNHELSPTLYGPSDPMHQLWDQIPHTPLSALGQNVGFQGYVVGKLTEFGEWSLVGGSDNPRAE